MKKTIILSIAVFILAATINAQTSAASGTKNSKVPEREVVSGRNNKSAKGKELNKLVGTEVSALAKQNFYRLYGNKPGAVWKRILNYDQVSFSSNGESMTAYYDAGAKLVGTIIQKKFSDLPEVSQKFINQAYPGYTKEAVVFFNDNELNETDIVVFNKQFEDDDCFYVKLKKADREILLKIKMSGEVSFFKNLV